MTTRTDTQARSARGPRFDPAEYEQRWRDRWEADGLWLGPAAADFYDARDAQGNVPSLNDVRVSPDGTMLLLAYSDDDGKAGFVTRYDVVNATTGAPVGIDVLGGFIPPRTPRWLPDSSGLYYQANPSTVERVAPENLHLTLNVLGRVEAAELDRLEAALTGVVADHPAFPLSCVGLGAFPTP